MSLFFRLPKPLQPTIPVIPPYAKKTTSKLIAQASKTLDENNTDLNKTKSMVKHSKNSMSVWQKYVML